MLISIVRLLRIQQWVKNCFIFFPVFFGRRIFDFDCWLSCICAFLAFGFASSGVYCLNDILDIDSDRKHPIKRNRPIASGVIGKKTGYFLMVMCWLISFFLLVICFGYKHYLLSASIVLLIYLILNIAYCLRLKHISIADVFSIALGFVLRVVIGGVVSDIFLSQWIILMTFLLALFIAIAKRRDDVAIYESSGVKLRSSIHRYNLSFMNLTLCIVASITMVCYIMYTLSDSVIDRIGSQYLYTTSVFVLAGIFRFLQVTIVDKKSGSPTKILYRDSFIHFCIGSWLIVFAILLYL